MSQARYSDIIAFTAQLIEQALSRSASDIHIEATSADSRIRMRIDGVLHVVETVARDIAQQIVSRIKVLANLDVAQKRVPQDGKWMYTHSHNIFDLRVSSFPALGHEHIVIRILQRDAHFSLRDLGMPESLVAQCVALLERPIGAVFAAGPTGSGKTTTLYAALSHLNDAARHIITLEDPVEYHLEGVTQGHIRPDAGFTFANGIRALLRQDPDVIMVGEMRDAETAQTAMQAALTGHLVLSTLHTGNAVSTIIRLLDMEIEACIVAAALSGIIAQRLMRTVCSACAQTYTPTEIERAQLKKLNINAPQLVRGVGCDSCAFSGYRGRTGIFEVLVLTDALRSVLMNTHQRSELEKILSAALPNTLADHARLLVHNGVTTLQEYCRVLGNH